MIALIAALGISACLLVYLIFIAWSIGLPDRLSLAMRRISLDDIPDRAVQRHGNRTLFTTDVPCAWAVPQMDRARTACAWSAREIRDTAAYLAAAFTGPLDLRHGERVAILKANHFDYHLLHHGIVRAGGVACPMNGNFASSKVDPYLVNVDAVALVTDVDTLISVLAEGGTLGGIRDLVIADRRTPDSDDLVRAALQAVQTVQVHWIEELLARVTGPAPRIRRGVDEPLYLVHSSGTTGFPKAVILENGRQSHAVRGWLCYVHIRRRYDKVFFAVPNNHQAVILTFNSALLAGLRGHWTGGYGRTGFDAADVLDQLATEEYTGFFGFPITYTQMKEHELDTEALRKMRFWACTADATHEAVIQSFVRVGSVFRRLGLPVTGSVFLDAQGSSEVGTPSVLRYYSRFTRTYGRRVGRIRSAPFGPRVRIAKNGAPVPRTEVGRLEVRGKTVFPAYWNNHTLTYEAVRDGWFFTGDVACISKDGHVVQLDREVDVIRTFRGDVYSLPIEEKIHFHPAVFDACVFGSRRNDGTQTPAAAIALRPTFTIAPDNLRDELNALLEPHEQLTYVLVLDWADFPIGVTGKTLKRTFRDATEGKIVPEANVPVVLAQQRRHPASSDPTCTSAPAEVSA